ncbi:methanethiol S-methyltransferase [Flavisphingomonas formosensis]|uniref:methanethiol S-methyltransferase n=1 Tax=Flavisphingomonas formosensis TaxID=861534 RepID=UPI0012F9D9BA|nr:methanethiol S-methyltransferase [Sphingomonas formosensis]
MARSSYLLFGVTAYFVFFATFLYLIGFIADAPGLPRTIDGPEPELHSLQGRFAIDAGLILLFGLQHSVMARRGFKAWWTRIVPEPIERSIYVLVSSIVLIVLMRFWQPLPHALWDLRGGVAAPLLWILFALGWTIVLVSTFLISHFELFGLKQVWANLRGAHGVAPTLRQPLFYRFVRHPLYSGFLIAFWATPHMTLGHLLLAAGLSLYILVAIELEERDLLHMFGADYARYRQRVGKLVPRLRRGGD